MTYSIVARDAATGQLGVAVQSRYFSVGSVVTWAEPGVGAVATQALARIEYGPEGLAFMREGLAAPEALQRALATDQGRRVRQVAMIDAGGHVAAHTGEMCIADAGHIVGNGYAVQANMMANPAVWAAMRDAYESAGGDFADRMLAALDAAQAAGGDIRGQQSAAMLIVSGDRAEPAWKRVLELRVEDHTRPLEELRRLLKMRKAYDLADLGDAAMTDRDAERAMRAFAQARALAPDNDELQFWAAITLFRTGHEDAALPLFREAFARNPALAELVPRLVPLGMAPSDPERMARILAERPPRAHA